MNGHILNLKYRKRERLWSDTEYKKSTSISLFYLHCHDHSLSPVNRHAVQLSWIAQAWTLNFSGGGWGVGGEGGHFTFRFNFCLFSIFSRFSCSWKEAWKGFGKDFSNIYLIRKRPVQHEMCFSWKFTSPEWISRNTWTKRPRTHFIFRTNFPHSLIYFELKRRYRFRFLIIWN